MDGVLDGIGGGKYPEKWRPGLEHIMSLPEEKRYRELYRFLLGMRFSDERTSIAIPKDYVALLKFMAELTKSTFPEVICHLIMGASENLAWKSGVDIDSLQRGIDDISDSMADFESQLDAATDAVLINAYGNLGAGDELPEDCEESLEKTLPVHVESGGEGSGE